MQYITREDREHLEAELNQRTGNRKMISQRIELARELGDLKENAEYHAAREDQGLNEAKIREIEEKLKTAIVTDSAGLPDDLVFLGATVTLKNLANDRTEQYRLVGETRGVSGDGVIEVTPSSPLGEALIKTRVGETIRVSTRRGDKRFEIIEISS
ncbi:MAG: transcription elongation factor GreA [Phycisphaerales bacterium]